ncbi:M81 family metallopeptidase [Asanoa sp. NPDC050611]|uniref:M81 family metallopeptidase n=1 Tax=Asanoa sp. NPDC050611 TaxID=3157098 RepID=UPI00340D1E29
MRLAALGLSHEANTFSTFPVDRAVIEEHTLRGDGIVAVHATARTTMAGYLAAAGGDVEVVPLVHCTLVPAGAITADALAAVADELVTALTEAGPFDGVLAALHGAAVGEECPDVDGYLLHRFRAAVGPTVPIGVALDLHANVSARMVACSDVLATYRTNPHVDARERALEVAELVVRTVRGEIRPTQAFQPVPAVINILCQNTGSEPMSEVMADLAGVLDRPGVLSATVAEGYPYADVPEMGMSVTVVTDADPDAAAAHARELAEAVWRRRSAFDTARVTPEEALRRVASAPATPLLLLDVGDNIGGGSPGDSVVLLNAARAAGLADLLTIVADPVSVAACERAGAGATVELTIGARSDPRTGPPVRSSATVVGLHDGAYEDPGPTHGGTRFFDAGRTAVVRLDSGQTVVLTSRVVMPSSAVQLTSLGLDPRRFAAVVAKGVHSPLAGYADHYAAAVWVDTPGVTSARLDEFSYTRRRRPLYPFEPEAALP